MKPLVQTRTGTAVASDDIADAAGIVPVDGAIAGPVGMITVASTVRLRPPTLKTRTVFVVVPLVGSVADRELVEVVARGPSYPVAVTGTALAGASGSLLQIWIVPLTVPTTVGENVRSTFRDRPGSTAKLPGEAVNTA